MATFIEMDCANPFTRHTSISVDRDRNPQTRFDYIALNLYQPIPADEEAEGDHMQVALTQEQTLKLILALTNAYAQNWGASA